MLKIGLGIIKFEIILLGVFVIKVNIWYEGIMISVVLGRIIKIWLLW